MTLLKTTISLRKLEILEHCWTIGAAAVSRLSLLLITLVNTQMMSADEFGTFAVLFLVANMVMAFVSCGGDMWLNRFTRSRHSLNKRPPIVSGLYLNISASLAGVVMLSALYFSIFGKGDFSGRGLGIAWCLLWAAMAGLLESILAVLRITHVIQRFLMIRDFLMPVSLIIAVFILKIKTAELFFMTASAIWILTLGFLCAFMLKNNHFLLRSQKQGKRFKTVVVGHTISLILNNFLARLANGQDTFLLARVESVNLVGRYRFVSHFAYAFNIIQHFVFLAFPWQLGQASRQMTAQGLQMVKFRQRLLLASALPALIILIFLAKPLLGLMGSGFQSMRFPLSMFLIIRFSELLWGPQHEVLVSNKKVNWDTLTHVICIAVGLLVFFIALPYKGGVTSGLMSVGFSSAAGQLARYFILKKYHLAAHPELRISFAWPILIVAVSMLYLVVKPS